MNILLAEDDLDIARSLIKNLEEEGYKVTHADDGISAFNLFGKENFDILLIDWIMPGMNGLQLCSKIRELDEMIPILILTAISEVSNKVEVLNAGADDYITKPFSFVEIVARINAVSRRNKKNQNKILFEEFILHVDKRKLSYDQEEIKLTEKEFDLLKYFIENKGSIISKDQLIQDIWELSFNPNTNIVEVTVKNLRKKIEQPSNKKYIKTIYGEGYIFIY